MKKSLKTIIKSLPQKPGVYFFKNRKEEVIYIGKAKNIRKRIQSHFTKKDEIFKQNIINYNKVSSIDFIETRSEKDALILERNLVRQNQPRYNLDLRDDKDFLYIAFMKEKYPRVVATHQKKSLNADFIGPIVGAKEAKELLEMIRKIFPYRTCKNSVDKPCLYYHMGLCNAHLDKSDHYNRVVAGVKTFLNIYNGAGSHIECYDISNTSGTLSVGSMVTFINNRPKKSLYRKFKIKTVSGSNDPKSIQEIIARRLNHYEWKYPDMAIVDGGKGQISKLKNVPFPVIGIAKRESSKRTRFSGFIHSPYGTGPIKISELPEIVGNTILAARDEAHRFAITYHRKRRIKEIK